MTLAQKLSLLVGKTIIKTGENNSPSKVVEVKDAKHIVLDNNGCLRIVPFNQLSFVVINSEDAKMDKNTRNVNLSSVYKNFLSSALESGISLMMTVKGLGECLAGCVGEIGNDYIILKCAPNPVIVKASSITGIKLMIN
jgi:hypothetical protein